MADATPTPTQLAAEVAAYEWTDTPADHVARLEVALMNALGTRPAGYVLAARWKCSPMKAKRLISEAEGLKLTVTEG